MSHFDLLEKRHHVRRYTDEIPPRYVVEHALWQAWKTTPSKNNAMPYKVIVYGPEQVEKKKAIHAMVHGNHDAAEHRAIERGQADKTEGGAPNPFYEHMMYNPYCICIHAQPREANDFYKNQIEKGMFFDQAWPERVDNFIDTSAIEVGMFLQNLTTYLLEKKIDVSYTSCFFRDIKKWHKAGLTEADYRPICLMSLGFSKMYRKDDPYIKRSNEIGRKDIKPEYKDMIKWV